MPRIPLPFVAFLATVLVRGIVAASRLDELELELYTGTFAWALLTGLPLHPDQLPIIAHLRGSVVFGVLLAPLYWLFGPTLGVMKAFAVLWSGFGAALFALVLQRAAGRRAAWVGLVLFALAPPAQQMVEVLALGSHADTLPFILGPLALLLGGEPSKPLSTRRSLALGAWLGAGALFSLQTCVAYLALLPVWLRVDPRAFRSLRLPWTAVGALPFVLLIPRISREAKLVNRGYGDWWRPDDALAKLANAAANELRDAWLFAERGAAWAGWVLFAAIAVALAYGVAKLPWRRLFRLRVDVPVPRAALLVAFSALHVAVLLGAYAVLDFHINLAAPLDGMGSRYFTPLLPALLAPVALGVAALADRSRAAAAGAFALLIASGVAGLATLVDVGVAFREPPVRGTELHEFRDHVEYAGGRDRAARLAWIERVSPDWPALRPLVYSGTFMPLDAKLASCLPPVDADVVAAEVAALRTECDAVRAAGFVGLGEAVGRAWVYDARSQPDVAVFPNLAERLAWMARRLDEREARWFARGVGRAAALHQGAIDLARNMPGRPDTGEGALAAGFRFIAFVPHELRDAVAEGMGVLWGLRASPYKRMGLRVLETARRLPSEHAQAFFRGYGWAYRYRFAEATYRVPDRGPLEARMEPVARAAFRAALDPRSAPEAPPPTAGAGSDVVVGD